MKILRLFIGNNNSACASVYRNGKIESEKCFSSTRQLAANIKRDIADVDCIYVFRGPGGFSRLRALNALARGIALGKATPLNGYTSWQTGNENSIACHNPKDILY